MWKVDPDKIMRFFHPLRKIMSDFSNSFASIITLELYENLLALEKVRPCQSGSSIHLQVVPSAQPNESYSNDPNSRILDVLIHINSTN